MVRKKAKADQGVSNVQGQVAMVALLNYAKKQKTAAVRKQKCITGVLI